MARWKWESSGEGVRDVFYSTQYAELQQRLIWGKVRDVFYSTQYAELNKG